MRLIRGSDPMQAADGIDLYVAGSRGLPRATWSFGRCSMGSWRIWGKTTSLSEHRRWQGLPERPAKPMANRPAQRRPAWWHRRSWIAVQRQAKRGTTLVKQSVRSSGVAGMRAGCGQVGTAASTRRRQRPLASSLKPHEDEHERSGLQAR